MNNILTRDARPLMLLGLLVGSFMYTVKLGPSPAYALVPGFAAISLLLMMLKPNIYISTIPRDVALAVVIMIYAAATQPIGAEHINLQMAMAGYVAARLLGRRLGQEKLRRVYKTAGWTCALVLLADTAYRMANPGTPEPEMYSALIGTDREFYIYKYNSMMFAHSNATAMVALSFLAAGAKMRMEGGDRNSYLFAALLVVVVLSLSRAAYLATAVLFAAFMYPRLTRGLRATTWAAVPIVAAAGFLYFQSDGSLLTKFTMWSDAFTYANGIPEILFGIGLGNTASIAGLAQHVLPLTYATEMGLVGALLVGVFVILLVMDDRRNLVILAPITVLSLSHFLYAGMAFFTIPLAIAFCHRRVTGVSS